MTYSRTAAIRRGRYEATEAIGVWTAAYDESGQMFWYDELTHETTYDPSAGRRHPQPHHQTMSHSAFFARGSTGGGGGGHMPPQMSLPHDNGDYLMPSGSAAYPCSASPAAAAAAAASGYVTSSGHMVSARAPSFTEFPSCSSSPLHHHHHQQHNHQQQQQQHYQQHHHHHHQHGRQGCTAAAAGSSLFGGYRWEECFKMDGKKFWRHKETGAIIHKDPYR